MQKITLVLIIGQSNAVRASSSVCFQTEAVEGFAIKKSSKISQDTSASRNSQIPFFLLLSDMC